MTTVFPVSRVSNRYRNRKRVAELVAAHAQRAGPAKTPDAIKRRPRPVRACNGLFTIGILG